MGKHTEMSNYINEFSPFFTIHCILGKHTEMSNNIYECSPFPYNTLYIYKVTKSMYKYRNSIALWVNIFDWST